MEEDDEKWYGPRGEIIFGLPREAYKKLLEKFGQKVLATIHIDYMPKWVILKKKFSDMGLTMSYNGKRKECGMSLLIDIGLTAINELEPIADAYNYNMKEYLEKQFKPFLREIKEEYLKQPLLDIHKEKHDEIHNVILQNVNDKIQKDIENNETTQK